MKNTDHIIMDFKTGKLECEHCGALEEPPFMPAPMNVVLGAMEHFIEQHKDCKPDSKPRETT